MVLETLSLIFSREYSLICWGIVFWFFGGFGMWLKCRLRDKSDNVYYGKSRDIRDLRYWCWINYFLGVLLLFLYLYKLNWM